MMRHAFFVVNQNFWAGVGFQNVLIGVDQKAARPRCRIANALGGLGRNHPHHYPNDVTRRAELAVASGGVEPAQQVFIKIALRALILLKNLHLINQLAGLDQQAGPVDLEFGVLHLQFKLE